MAKSLKIQCKEVTNYFFRLFKCAVIDTIQFSAMASSGVQTLTWVRALIVCTQALWCVPTNTLCIEIII